MYNYWFVYLFFNLVEVYFFIWKFIVNGKECNFVYNVFVFYFFINELSLLLMVVDGVWVFNLIYEFYWLGVINFNDLGLKYNFFIWDV